MSGPPIEGTPVPDTGTIGNFITEDLACKHCGHNLRTLSRDAVCPECGSAWMLDNAQGGGSSE